MHDRKHSKVCAYGLEARLRAPKKPPRRKNNSRSGRAPREQGTEREEGDRGNSGLEERESARKQAREGKQENAEHKEAREGVRKNNEGRAKEGGAHTQVPAADQRRHRATMAPQTAASRTN